MQAKARPKSAPETRARDARTALLRLGVGPYNGEALAIDGLARVQCLSPEFTQVLVDYFTDLSALRALPKGRTGRRRRR